MFKGAWKAVNAKAGKSRVEKAEREREKGRRRKEIREKGIEK